MAVDSAYPAVVPDRQYWGTFYYPWYGDGELSPLNFTKENNTSPLLGHTEPEVIRVNQTFYLYYRTDSSIAVANSTNGQDWNELGTILTPSPTGWDSSEVISPSVIVEGGTYYLFYEADDKSVNRAIGFATSTSPAGPFTKHPNNPILIPSQPWEGTIVGTPAITKIGTTYYLFYHGFSDGKDKGGVAYSSNLLSWTKEANNPILDTGPGSWDGAKVAPSDVYSSATSLWVFYEGYNGTSWRIGLATATPDPIDRRVKNLTKQSAPILDLGQVDSFDSHTAQLPTVVLAGAPNRTELWLYYSGNNGQAFHLLRANAKTHDTYRHWRESKPADQYHSPPDTWASMYLPDDLSGGFNPTKQLYSSRSTTVIDRHLAWMNYARFDFALVSWWGQNSYEDKAFRVLLDRAQLSGSSLKLGIYYELQDNSTAEIEENLRYILNNYGSSPSFFKVTNGTLTVPAIFVYMVGTVDRFNMTDRWRDARAKLYSEGTPVFISLKVFGNYRFDDNDRKVDGWHQYSPCESNSSDGLQGYELQPGYSAFASPGYWEYPELGKYRNQTGPGRPCAYLPRNSTRFAEAVNRLATLPWNDAKFLLVETFNEFHEGSQIEPAIPLDHNESEITEAGKSYRTSFLDIVHYRGQSPEFSISTSPQSLNIEQGSSGTSSIVLSSINGFEGVVKLNFRWDNGSFNIFVSLNNPYVAAGSTVTETVTIYTHSSDPPGCCTTLTVTGTSSPLSHSTKMTARIVATPSHVQQVPAEPTIYALGAALIITAVALILVVRRSLRKGSFPTSTNPGNSSLGDA